MSRKIYVNPQPEVTRPLLIAQVILGIFFLLFGMMFIFIADDEARPFVAVFLLIWVTACIAIIMHAVKLLRLMKKIGKIEVAEIEGAVEDASGDFAERLRALEALKNDGLISDDEYREKRAEIMQTKW